MPLYFDPANRLGHAFRTPAAGRDTQVVHRHVGRVPSRFVNSRLNRQFHVSCRFGRPLNRGLRSTTRSSVPHSVFGLEQHLEIRARQSGVRAKPLAKQITQLVARFPDRLCDVAGNLYELEFPLGAVRQLNVGGTDGTAGLLSISRERRESDVHPHATLSLRKRLSPTAASTKP